MSTQLTLGAEVTHEDKKFLVVRIVESLSLFEDLHQCYVVNETYAELRGPNNEIDFITVLEGQKPFEEKTSPIKALPSLPWRVKR